VAGLTLAVRMAVSQEQRQRRQAWGKDWRSPWPRAAANAGERGGGAPANGGALVSAGGRSQVREKAGRLPPAPGPYFLKVLWQLRQASCTAS